MTSYEFQFSNFIEVEEFLNKYSEIDSNLLQLSSGNLDFKFYVVEFPKMKLVWSKTRGRTKWSERLDCGGVNFGVVIEAQKIPLSCGKEFCTNNAQLWLSGQEIDFILDGDVYALEVNVEADLIEELGWDFTGDPIRSVSNNHLRRLIKTCHQASSIPRILITDKKPERLVGQQLAFRDHILEQLEKAMTPWLKNGQSEKYPSKRMLRYSECIKHADKFFMQGEKTSLIEVDELSRSIGVHRRTIFRAFRETLGIGPRRYFEIKRLHNVRRRLLGAPKPGSTISNIARELGFTELGRFAGLYRQQFGEYPNETLSRE